jgi:CubicO group peptidase (beta-lactamase class C family)
MTRFTVALSLIALTATAGAQSSKGFSRERLQRLDKIFNEYVEDNRVAGVVALVLQDGRAIYEAAIGWADKEDRRRMQKDTLFRIASQTKAVTSVATLILIEEGRLTLTDQVGRFIPSFAKTSVAVASGDLVEIVPARRPITVRDLLTHTAGISYGTNRSVADQYAKQGLGREAGYGWYTADKDEPICTTIERLGTLPFVAQPGESWVYGYNTDVLGCLVERVSGMPLDQFIRTRITEPLKMRDTFFFLPRGERDRLAAVYARDDNGRILRAPNGARGQGHYVEGPRRSFAGGAGLLSTVHDYARFLEMIRLDGELDGVRILSPRAVRLLHTNLVGTLHSTSGLGWGLAFETTDRFGARGLACAGSYGWGGAYGTTYLIDRETRLTMLMMQQVVGGAGDLGQKFQTLVYQALLDSPSDRCVGVQP